MLYFMLCCTRRLLLLDQEGPQCGSRKAFKKSCSLWWVCRWLNGVIVDDSSETLDVRPCNDLPPHGCFRRMSRTKLTNILRCKTM